MSELIKLHPRPSKLLHIFVELRFLISSPSLAQNHCFWKTYQYPIWKPWCTLKEFDPLPHSGCHCCVFISFVTNSTRTKMWCK